MDKILQWLEKSIIYSFSNSEPIFDNYFKALTKLGLVIEPKGITMDYEKCEIHFETEFNAVLINGEVFVRPVGNVKESIIDKVNVEKPIETKEKTGFEPPDEGVDPPAPIIIYTVIGDTLYANNTGVDPFIDTALIKVFFKEAYPDHAESEEIVDITVPPGKSAIYKCVDNRVVSVMLGNAIYELEYKANYYFTNVKSLKEAFIDTGLKLPNKTDNQYKEKIMEKSLYLKKKFGLTEEETQNHEMFPSFKRLTTLYCLQDLVAFTFIQGEAESGGGDTPTTSNSLSLGKFSTKDGTGSSGGSGSSSSGFLPEILADQIAIAEEDVRKSIFLKSDKVYWFKKTGAMTNE